MQETLIADTNTFETKIKEANNTTIEIQNSKPLCNDCNKNEVVMQGFCQNCYDYHYGIRTPSIKRIFKKVGRNATCPCGSGLKFKNCCKTEENLLKKAQDIRNNA